MSYIDLKLKQLEKDEQNEVKLIDIIMQNTLIVILGAPGSGKTSILKKYEEDNKSNTKFIKVKNFIKFSTKIEETTTVLLLDGLDEYRSVTEDKTFVLSELGNKLNNLIKERTDLNVVISCREMDWYGEADTNALKDEVNQIANLYSILPLDYQLQNELAELLGIDNKDEFLDKFSQNGFLDNPQMFFMLSEIWKSDKSVVSSKKMLYEKFIINAREHNNNHQQSNLQIEQNDIFKYVGYISFYYMFCGIEELDEDFIDEIVNDEKSYKRELIEGILKTKLFNENKFIHRTIAEYSLAKYILEYKLDGVLSIDKKRIKHLFIKNNKVPTELRGTYAWLCSLSEDAEFIKVDPYYQAIHGDNTLFHSEQKKEIILAVKEYSIKNPYFFEFGQKMELDGFYNDNLDDFLIEEFKEAIKLKSHYVYFIVHVIVQSNNPSNKIKSFVDEIINDNEIATYFKRDFVQVFKDDNIYLIELLNKIKNNAINDVDDFLKEDLLRILYPQHISHLEIADYLMLYKSDVGGYCNYLYKTSYEDKYDLVDKIFKTSFSTEKEPYLNLPKNVKGFIKDYFLETLLEFEDTKTAEDIYKFIVHFKQYYKKYYNLKFKSYRYAITDKLKLSDEKLQRLVNELYALFIEDMLINKPDKFRIHNFNYFFNYKNPNNQSNILLNKLNTDFDRNLNLDLLFSGLNYLPRDTSNKIILLNDIDEIIKSFGFEKEFDNWKNPKKQDWEIESELREQERIDEENETKQKNEEYFKEKSDEDIQKHFGDLNWISNLFYLKDDDEGERYLETKTLERLKNILKNAIYNKLITAEFLTLESMATDSTNAHRYIDTMYYVSLILNNGSTIKIKDTEFLKYLYLNALQHSRVGNIEHSDLIKQLEEDDLDFAISLLKDYIELLLEIHFLEIKTIVMYFISKEDNIENLKTIAISYESNLATIQNSILDNFLSCYGFEISSNSLNILINIEMSIDNKNSIEALKIFHEDKKEDFTVNMAIAFYELIKDKYNRELYKRFQSFETNLKIKIISYIMTAFNTSDSIERVNGIQSSKNQCADFLTSYSLILLSIDELKKLVLLHPNKDDIWNYKILNKINELEQQESNVIHGSYSIHKIKEFIFKNAIASKEDFFEDICLKIEKLKQEIEDNRLNEKLVFYNEGNINKPKLEDRCRDIVVQRLKASYDDIVDLTKELHEANNRVDINIRYKKDLQYEVQVECKRDDNGQLYNAIKNQLIDKYFSSGVQFGVYLIFYFGSLKNEELMMKKVHNSLPKEYGVNIKIICIDLRI